MLTPEQAADLVAHFGGKRPAARGAGVPYTSLLYWLDPEPIRAQRRDRYEAEPEHREEKRAYMRDYYDAMDGYAYNRRRLMDRRWQALNRRAKRNADRASK